MSDNSIKIVPVILSGGSGTRLWPVSTEGAPKQFLNLTGPLSMFQLTLQRCDDTERFLAPIIVGSARHAKLLKTQLDEIDTAAHSIILEPCARNTAPAIALAALATENKSDLLLVMPSDHVITNPEKFVKAVTESAAHAQARWLMTFGIEPSGPETGYGYIKQGDELIGSRSSFSVERFVEKPNHENAQKMLSEGGYHWNAGIFLFRADTYLEALETHAPEMLKAAEKAMTTAHREHDMITPNEGAFSTAPSDSIDYAVMEKAEKVGVTPVDPGWSDVGSWDSLFEISDKDEASNVVSGRTSLINSTGNLIHAGDLDIAVKGVDDLIVVANGKTVMILPRGNSQDVKQIARHHSESDKS